MYARMRNPGAHWLAFAIAGLAALVWGAGTATAADVAPSPHEGIVAAAEVGDLVISSLTVDGADSTVTISNVSGGDIELEGTFVCNFPSYWRMGSLTLAAGESITVNAGSGADGGGVVFAGGGFGELGSPGEVALYENASFDDPSAMIAYVGWNGGLLRKAVAQAAGLWGADDVAAEVGDTIRKTGAGTGADAYSAGAADVVAALPSVGSGGLANTGDSPVAGLAPIVWGALAAGAVLAFALSGRRLWRTRVR